MSDDSRTVGAENLLGAARGNRPGVAIAACAVIAGLLERTVVLGAGVFRKRILAFGAFCLGGERCRAGGCTGGAQHGQVPEKFPTLQVPIVHFSSRVSSLDFLLHPIVSDKSGGCYVPQKVRCG